MKIKYNWEFDRYVTDDGKVLRYDSKQDKLVLCGFSNNGYGYLRVGVSKPRIMGVYVHRLVYETFNGKIPDGYETDHINTIRNDNRLENLRICNRSDNLNNPLTRKHISEAQKGKTLNVVQKNKISESLKGNTNKRGKAYSEFGTKFKEHFGITRYENTKLYNKERKWYITHNKVCSWEMNTDERN